MFIYSTPLFYVIHFSSDVPSFTYCNANENENIIPTYSLEVCPAKHPHRYQANSFTEFTLYNVKQQYMYSLFYEYIKKIQVHYFIR